ncbi:MAG: hypothetical protein ACE5WD_00495 [Candidatus Aminicenantia bacterium]
MKVKSMDELKRSYRLATIIGIAMIASLFVYVAVIEFIKKNSAPLNGFAPFPEVDILRYVLLGVAIACFFLIRFIKNRILSGKATIQKETIMYNLSAPIQRLLTASIITYAFCESVAIIGLVLFFIAGNSLDFYTFMVISLILFSIYFPRYNQWEEWIKKQGIRSENIEERKI